MQIQQYQMQRLQYIKQLQQYGIQYRQHAMLNKFFAVAADSGGWVTGNISEKTQQELIKIDEDYTRVEKSLLEQIRRMKKAAGQE